MNWRNRNVFVTGGNGFLGSYVVRELLNAGARVTCLIRESIPGSRFHVDGLDRFDHVTCVSGALEDFDLLCRVLVDQEIDTVFHLAAKPIVGEAIRDPLPSLEANIRGTYYLLEAARRWGKLRAFPLITSDKVFGESERLPYRETDPLLGAAPYDASKVCADVMAQCYAKTYAMPIGVMRAGNFFGPGDMQWSRIIPGTIRKLLSGERPVIRSDGTLLRDYLYVEDAARGMIALGVALDRREVRGEVFNFGTGTPTSVLDLVKMLIVRSKTPEMEPVIENRAAHEIQAQYLDSSKAWDMLRWKATTTLEQGLDVTWAWYERFFGGSQT